jgi:hypothetical protein
VRRRTATEGSGGGSCWRRRRSDWGQAGPDLGRTGLVLDQVGLDLANAGGAPPCCSIAGPDLGQVGLVPAALGSANREVPPTSEKVEAVLWLLFGGEFGDADKLTGLTGGVVASVTARLCPRASWRGCSFAVVRGLGRAILRGVRLRRRRPWHLASTWRLGGGLGRSGMKLQLDGGGSLGAAARRLG